MDIGEGLLRVRKQTGLSQRDFAEKAGMSYGHLCELENNKNIPTLRLLRDILRNLEKNGIAVDAHFLAHAAFELPTPGEMDELEGDLKELCDLVMSMSEEERAKLLASIKKYIDSKDNLFSFDKAAEPKSKYRGGDTLQAPPVAKAGGG